EPARDALKKAVELQSDAVMPFRDYARACNQLGRVKSDARAVKEEAATAYRRALLLDSNWAEGHAALGALHVELGRDVEAVDAYRKALALTPEDLDVIAGLGGALTRLGRVEESV